MVVHRLPGKLHAPCDAGCGIWLKQSRENLQPERMMKEYGGLGRFANKVEFQPRRGFRILRMRAGDLPTAAAGDTHDSKQVSKQGAEVVFNGPGILSRPVFRSI